MPRRWLPLLLAMSLAGCAGEPDDPESRLRAAIASAEQAVEDRAVERAAAIIAADYHDERGHDSRALTRLLLGYLHRHRNIHLVTRIGALHLDDAARTADVELYVAMTGTPVQSFEGLAAMRADLHRFELHFVDAEQGWQLQRADWRRAGLEEVLP